MLNLKEIDLIDQIDSLTNHTAQLEAMLCIIYGAGFDSFNNFNDDIKQNYLWVCAEHARQVNKIAVEISQR